MMRSMFSGVSGLKVHQTKMDVIGNNIANVNTVGYKSQRVTFSDVFSQTISASSSANDETGRGGVNAMQVGLGVNVSSIDMLMTQGAAQRTDNPFDLMINGDGFIVVGDATGQYFTRSGALRQDDDGNLVISNGMKVQGWLANKDNNSINSQEVQDINLADPTIKNSSPAMTSKGQLSGNINSTETSGTTSVSFYDSIGNYYTLNLKLDRKKAQGWTEENPSYEPNEWTLSPANVEGTNVIVTDAKGKKVEIPQADLVGDGKTFPFEIKFNTNGKLDTAGTTAQATSFKLSLGDNVGIKIGSSFSDIEVDISGLTQYATKTNIDTKALNGSEAGTLSGYSIGGDGIITATYSNGDLRKIAQVVLAEFDNPTGLEKVGDNLYSMTSNSGQFDGIGSAGVFNTGVLEMSNVDLSSEFTDMIITQRGFQANSRIISVSDEMLQELTNLKR